MTARNASRHTEPPRRRRFPPAALLLSLALAFSPAAAAASGLGVAPWTQTEHLSPEVSGWIGNVGSALAFDEDTLVVGTQIDRHDDPGWRNPEGDGHDRAYVFERNADDAWIQTAELIPEDAHEGDTFAYSVDVDGAAGVAVAGNPVSSKAYVFERVENGSWIQTASFELPDSFSQDRELYGYSVAVSGDTIAVGWHPSLFLYEKEQGSWTEAGSLAGGIHVALEGSTLVTSRWESATDTNTFLVYTREKHGWTPVGRLDPAGPYDNENTDPGRVDLSSTEDQIVLGSPIDRRVLGVDLEGAGPDPSAVGSVWIYEHVDGQWVQTADIPNPNPAPTSPWFGHSVGIEDDRTVIGAPWSPYNGGGEGSGAAYVYEKVDGEWRLTSKLRNHDNGPYGGGDLFGEAVDIGSDTALVGAPFDDQRQDGTPAPVNDNGDIPPCVHREYLWACQDGEDRGSVYAFEPATSSSKGTLP